MPFDNTPITETETQLQRDLRAAAAVIRTRGLATYARLDANNRVCVHGALALVTGTGDCHLLEGADNDRHKAAGQALHRLLVTEGFRFGFIDDEKYGCAEWNNEEGRTVEQVASALERTAKIARENA